MKRTIIFEVLDDKYTFTENGKEVLGIDKSSLVFDVKLFYQAFFSEGMDFEHIEVVSSSELDKLATHIYNSVRQLIDDICKNIAVANQNAEDVP